MTTEEIKKIISTKNDRYARNKKYYRSDNPDLKHTWEERRLRGIDPNNYAPSGYARYIVDIMTGYVASPGYVEYASENEEYIDVISAVNKLNKEPTLTNKQVREAGIQGCDYELHFVKKDSQGMAIPRFVMVPGYECYPVYTKELDAELEYMIRVVRDDEDTAQVWVYGEKEYQIYKLYKGELTAEGAPEKHYYDQVPWNIGQNNTDSEPDFEQVVRYINIIDAIQTNTLNSLDQNSRAVILTSLKKTTELAKNLKNLNMIFEMEKGDGEEGKDFFDYASMELNEDLREFMLAHFINELHKISGIFDFTKLELGTDPSGTALKYRIYPMELKASEKVAFRLEFLRHRYELVNQILTKFTLPGGKRVSSADVDELKISMKRNLPANVKAILEENMLMLEYVDKETLLERVPEIDPQEVKKRLKEEAPTDVLGLGDGELRDA